MIKVEDEKGSTFFYFVIYRSWAFNWSGPFRGLGGNSIRPFNFFWLAGNDYSAADRFNPFGGNVKVEGNFEKPGLSFLKPAVIGSLSFLFFVGFSFPNGSIRRRAF